MDGGVRTARATRDGKEGTRLHNQGLGTERELSLHRNEILARFGSDRSSQTCPLVPSEYLMANGIHVLTENPWTKDEAIRLNTVFVKRGLHHKVNTEVQKTKGQETLVTMECITKVVRSSSRTHELIGWTRIYFLL